MVIGDIFIRVYNEQPTFIIEVRVIEVQGDVERSSIWHILFQNAKGFAADLLEFLANQLQYLYSLLALKMQNGSTNHADSGAQKLRNVEMALESLRNVLKTNPGKRAV